MATTIERLQVEIESNTRGAEAGFKRVEGRAQTFGRRMERIGGRVSGLGRTMTKSLTLPFAVAGGLAVKSAIDFESAFAGVRKTVDATEEEFSALAQGFRDMAKEMPVTVEELSAIGEAAGQLGIKKENILGFTETVAQLGVTTNLASEEAATAFARIANITGMPQEEFDRLGATIVDLGNNLATTEKEITEFALRIAGAGELAGLAESDILAIGGAMSSVGVKAERGGTAVQKALLTMQEAVATGNDHLKIIADTAGMTAEEFKKAWEQDAGKAFTSFVEGLGTSEEEVFGIFKDLGLDAERVKGSFLALSGAGDLLRESIERGNQAWSENSALVKEAAKRFGTTEAQMRTFLNRINDLGITIGQQVIPAITEALDSLSDEDMKEIGAAVGDFLKMAVEVGKQFLEVYKDIPDDIKKLAFQAAAFGAIAGPILTPVGGLLRILGGFGRTAGGLGRAAGGIGRLANKLPGFSGAATTATGAAGGLKSSLRGLGKGVGVASAAIAGAAIGTAIEKHIIGPLQRAAEESDSLLTDIAAFNPTAIAGRIAGGMNPLDALRGGPDALKDVERSLQNFINAGRITREEAKRVAAAIGTLGKTSDLSSQEIADLQGTLTLAATRGADMKAVIDALGSGMSATEVRTKLLNQGFGAAAGKMRELQTEGGELIRVVDNASGEMEILKGKGENLNSVSLGTLKGSISQISDRLNISEGDAIDLLRQVNALDKTVVTDHILRQTINRRIVERVTTPEFHRHEMQLFESRKRAHGGPVFADQPFLVGERGPELFVPNIGGQVIPTHELDKLRSDGGDISFGDVHVHAAPGDDAEILSDRFIRAVDRKLHERQKAHA